MVVATLALIGAFVATYLFLYKIGAFGAIACGDGGCEVVQNSPWADFLGVPVAGWGLVGFIAIFVTAFLGTQPRFAQQRWISYGLLTLTGVAFLFSIYLSILEEFVIHAWCRWCIVSAIISTLAFGFSLPEIGRLRRGGR
jgi:uncharacterized membrane protein